MHENRETSSVFPASGGRTVKANSPKTVMHVVEDSDLGIVCAEQHVVQEG
jgi:hypothetical protein